MQAVNKYTCGSSSAVWFELTKGLVSKTNQSLQTAQASVYTHRDLLLLHDGEVGCFFLFSFFSFFFGCTTLQLCVCVVLDCVL